MAMAVFRSPTLPPCPVSDKNIALYAAGFAFMLAKEKV